ERQSDAEEAGAARRAEPHRQAEGAPRARGGAAVTAMPPHAVASGTISFGLVSIPVKLYTATPPQKVSTPSRRVRSTSGSIEIAEFVPLESVDFLQVEKSYY